MMMKTRKQKSKTETRRNQQRATSLQRSSSCCCCHFLMTVKIKGHLGAVDGAAEGSVEAKKRTACPHVVFKLLTDLLVDKNEEE